MNGLVLDERCGHRRDALGRSPAGRGIETRPFFLGMHRQPALLDRGLSQASRIRSPTSSRAQGLYLPSGAGSTDDQVDS